jgi:hypothetical protein
VIVSISLACSQVGFPGCGRFARRSHSIHIYDERDLPMNTFLFSDQQPGRYMQQLAISERLNKSVYKDDRQNVMNPFLSGFWSDLSIQASQFYTPQDNSAWAASAHASVNRSSDLENGILSQARNEFLLLEEQGDQKDDEEAVEQNDTDDGDDDGLEPGEEPDSNADEFDEGEEEDHDEEDDEDEFDLDSNEEDVEEEDEGEYDEDEDEDDDYSDDVEEEYDLDEDEDEDDEDDYNDDD